MRSFAFAAASLFLFLSTFSLAQTFSDPGFIAETYLSTGSSPMGLTWASDGRVFVWRKPGIVQVFTKDLKSSKVFLDIHTRVNKTTDRGLIGFALDPNFATNGFFYLAYVFENNGNPDSTGPKTQRVSRFKVSASDPTIGDPNSEMVILGKVATPGCAWSNVDCMPNDIGTHTIDQLQFHGGKLYVSVGDGGNYSTVDPHALRAQDLTALNGKILRVNTDGTGPSDNPFYDGNPNSNRSKVYSYGLRNPFRFTIAPNGEPYIGDVGWNNWEEVDTGRGKNFGWPCYEGNGVNGPYMNGLAQCQSLPSSAVTLPLVTYPHSLGACIIGGPVYSGSTYPASYQNNVFYADYVGKWIRRSVLDASGHVVATYPFVSGLSAPVYLTQGADGNLYYIEIVAQQVKRIRYTGSGNRPPVAKASANPTYGMPPLTVSFSSAGTSDPDGNTLTYHWDFGDGATSGSPNTTHQYAVKGKYSVVLTVKDPSGGSDTASVVITVGSTPPQATIAAPANGIHVDVNSTISYSGSAWDPEDGNLTGSSLVWTVIIHHNNTHTHDYFQATGSSGSFIMPAHDTTSTFYLELKLTATDSSGLTNSKSVNIYPNLPASSGCAQPGTTTAVVVCTPAAGATVPSPVHVTAAGGSAIVLMELWVDGQKMNQWNARSIDTTVSLANGAHKLTVFGKTSSGATTSQPVTFAVGSTSGTCAVPSSPGVNICSPGSGATVALPVHVLAAGQTAGTFARMELWVDGAQKFVTASKTLDTSVTLGPGQHRFAVLAIDTSGAVINKAIYATVQ